MSRALLLGAMVVAGTSLAACSSTSSAAGLPVTVTGHSRATASAVQCSTPDDGVVTVSGILTGTSNTPVHGGVAVWATVYRPNGRVWGRGLWPPASLRKGQSKGFRMPVGSSLPVIQSSNPNLTPTSPSIPTSFPSAARCSLRLQNFTTVSGSPPARTGQPIRA